MCVATHELLAHSFFFASFFVLSLRPLHCCCATTTVFHENKLPGVTSAAAGFRPDRSQIRARGYHGQPSVRGVDAEVNKNVQLLILLLVHGSCSYIHNTL